MKNLESFNLEKYVRQMRGINGYYVFVKTFSDSITKENFSEMIKILRVLVEKNSKNQNFLWHLDNTLLKRYQFGTADFIFQPEGGRERSLLRKFREDVFSRLLILEKNSSAFRNRLLRGLYSDWDEYPKPFLKKVMLNQRGVISSESASMDDFLVVSFWMTNTRTKKENYFSKLLRTTFDEADFYERHDHLFHKMLGKSKKSNSLLFLVNVLVQLSGCFEKDINELRVRILKTIEASPPIKIAKLNKQLRRKLGVSNFNDIDYAIQKKTIEACC